MAYTIGIILLTCATLAVIFPFILMYKHEDPIYFFWLIVAFVASAVGAAIITSVPYKKDVINGTAVYVEELHVYGNDTVKTYDIVFKKELKKHETKENAD